MTLEEDTAGRRAVKVAELESEEEERQIWDEVGAEGQEKKDFSVSTHGDDPLPGGPVEIRTMEKKDQ